MKLRLKIKVRLFDLFRPNYKKKTYRRFAKSTVLFNRRGGLKEVPFSVIN